MSDLLHLVLYLSLQPGSLLGLQVLAGLQPLHHDLQLTLLPLQLILRHLRLAQLVLQFPEIMIKPNYPS